MLMDFSNSARRTPAQKGKDEKPVEPHGEEMSKPTWLHLMDKDDLEAQVKRKEIKQISKRKSISKAPLLELKTVLKIL